MSIIHVIVCVLIADFALLIMFHNTLKHKTIKITLTYYLQTRVSPVSERWHLHGLLGRLVLFYNHRCSSNNYLFYQKSTSVHPHHVKTAARAPTSLTATCAHAQVVLTESTVRQVKLI